MKLQTTFYGKDGRVLSDPVRAPAKYCRAYGLHIEWVKEIITDDTGRCLRFEGDL